MIKGATIIDLGAWAEDHFSGLCSRAGVTRNKPQQDRTGWDYIIEWAMPMFAEMPADLQPLGPSARVQIKSKEKGKACTVLKLSNALRFAKEPAPCFIVLYLAQDGSEPIRIFARHFWREEITRTLQRAREAHSEKRADLNNLTMRFSFTAVDEHTDDLIAWMAATLASQSDYAAEKQRLLKTLGFEDGHIHGTVSFPMNDLGAFVDHQIGLAPAPPIEITLKERRFGIDARTPIFAGKPDFASLISNPLPCRVRVRRLDGIDIWLDGGLLPAIPGLPLEAMKLRVIADFLEIIIGGKGESKVTLNIDDEQCRSLGAHRAMIDVTQAAINGPLEVTVTSPGQHNLSLKIALPNCVDDLNINQYSAVIALLEQISVGILPIDHTVSSGAIYAAWNDLVDMNGLVNGTDFKGSFNLEAPIASDVVLDEMRPRAAHFFYDIQIGDWTFGTVVRRPIEHVRIQGTRGSSILGPGRPVEGLVCRVHRSKARADLIKLFRQAQQPEIETSLEFCGGDYRAFLALNRAKAVSIT
jgi:hypothetical protein